MAHTLSKTEHYFGGHPEAPVISAREVSERWDAYLAKVDSAATVPFALAAQALGTGQRVFENGRATIATPTSAAAAIEKAMGDPDLVKALGADSLASINAALAQVKADIPDLTKDISTTSPLSTGLVAYDLEAPAKMLTPRPTPLRNRITRKRGIGSARKFKVISGFTGVAGPNPLPLIRPGITETTQNDFKPTGAANSLFYARGPKISYQGYDVSVPYKQFSLSDEVTWAAQYEGQGFQDVRQLSRTSLMYASMLAEERLLLGGRGAAADNFAGALAAPGTITVTARAAAAGETGLSGLTTNVFAKVTAETVWGESVLSSAATAAVSNGQVADISVGVNSAGATGYRVYVSTGASDPGDGSRFYAGRTGYKTFTLQGVFPTTGRLASAVSADTSASSLDYDGILTVCAAGAGGQASGYVKRLDAVFSTTNPGTEFQTAFALMYDPGSGGVLADPDRVLMNGLDRKQLSDALQKASSSNYNLRLTQDEITGVTLGSVATAVVNEVTGKRVELEVHPYLPQGNAPIISETLPIPDTQISEAWSVVNVQDLMGVDWTPQQFAFESSSYWLGTFLCQAPQWQGIVQGIQKV